MPYISTEKVREIRKELKAALPEFKLSVAKRHSSTVVVSIMSGPLEYPGVLNPERKRDYMQINVYWYTQHYEGLPEWQEVFKKISDIATKEQTTLVEDGDYGTVPTYYFDLNIGKWDKGYICTTPPAETKPESFTETLKKAVDEGKRVYYLNENYQVVKDQTGQYLIKCNFNNAISSVFWADNETLNGKPEDYKIQEKDEIDQVYDELFKAVENRKLEGVES